MAPAQQPRPILPVKLMGHITWTYPDEPSETFPVTRAIADGDHATFDCDHVTLECDCGSPHAPYIYTIDTRRSSDSDFFGTFTAGKSRNRSSGEVSGRYEIAENTLWLRGVWIEQGVKSDWLAELHAVKAFPGEVEANV
jgi:hypothetical protein